jgi:Lytic transglycolase
VRRPRVVANVALIAMLATVAVPGPVGSRALSPLLTPSAEVFANVEMDASVRGPALTIPPLDPGARSDGYLDRISTMFEPTDRSEPTQARSAAAPPTAESSSVSKNPWHFDPEVSWYGPGLIGNGTACGQKLTRTLIGVAHRTLPCGTLITFRANGHTITAPVVDRGPYVSGRIFDLTYGLCKKLEHCYTGPIRWHYGGRG